MTDVSGAVIAYSIYYITNIQIGTTYKSALVTNTWNYYTTWIKQSDLDVLFILTPTAYIPHAGTPAMGTPSTAPNVDLWLAAVSSSTSPLVPIFPTDANGVVTYQHTSGQEVVELDADGGFQDGLYIIGVYCPVGSGVGAGAGSVSAYSVMLQGDVYVGVTGGVQVSMFAIVAALVVLVLCLFSAAALIARRRRSYIRDLLQYDSPAAQMELMHRIQMRALADGRAVTPAIVEAYHGATESQIGRLPSHVYVDGEMNAEDAKCTICLDDYVAKESTVKALHCGHCYHEECITKWLHTRKHCPLCLQTIDNAQDVARHDKPVVGTPGGSGRAVDVGSGAGVSAAVVGVSTLAVVSPGSEDGVRTELSAAPSSTVVDGASSQGRSSQRRSASGHDDGMNEMQAPRTSDSGLEERKENS